MTADLIRCSDVSEQLPLYVGGDLERDIESRVREHIARCPACSELSERACAARRAFVDALRFDFPPASSRAPREARGPRALAGAESPGAFYAGVRERLVSEGLLPAACTKQAAPRQATPPSLAPGARGRSRTGRWFPLAALACAAALLIFAIVGGPPSDSGLPAGTGALASGSEPGAAAGPGLRLVNASGGAQPLLDVDLPAAGALGGHLRRMGVDEERMFQAPVAERARPRTWRRRGQRGVSLASDRR